MHEDNFAITPLVVYDNLAQYDLLPSAVLEDGTPVYISEDSFLPNIEYIRWQM